jgi:hypothetical protein
VRQPSNEELARAARELDQVLALADVLPRRAGGRIRAAPAARVSVAERVVGLHRALDDCGVPHAFRGAIALAYWTLEPRGAIDIDA